MRLFIIAGCAKGAFDYARQHGLLSVSTFLYRPEQLQGLYQPVYVKTGSWDYFHNIKAIEDELKVCQGKHI